MNTKDLLSKLSALERVMCDFSYEELNIDEATAVKNSFLTFKTILEQGLVKQHTVSASSTVGDLNTEKNLQIIQNEAASKSEDALISRVSHEIRTPLSGILGFTDLLLESKLTEEQLQQVTAIQSASHFLIEIVNELLEYSKLSIGQAHFENIDFNLRNLVNDVSFLCTTLITEKKVHLDTHIEKNIPKVLIGDPTKLNQILLNLLGNAIKFVHEGEIKLNINLKKIKGNMAFLEFHISDTGIGIAEEHLKHIFDPYIQTEKSSSHENGYGLGLSIVKRIITVLDGDITVTSNLGQGTTFIFNLPYVIGTEQKVKQRSKSPIEGVTDEGLLEDKRILVFEDNLLNQKLIEQRLKTWQCSVIVTDDPKYGLKVLEDVKIDLVLMDLWMPIMTGFEAAEHIRKSENPRVRIIPIIALTADLSLENQELCKIHGINDFVIKPYNPKELLSKLLKNLNGMKSNSSPSHQQEKLQSENAKTHSKIDLKHVLEDCMGDLNLLEELVRLYQQNALEFMGAVKFHLQDGDFEKMKFAAHKIKSGLAMMRTFSLREIAFAIHKVCEIGQDKEEVRKLAKSFADEYLIIEKLLNEELEDIRNSNQK